VNILLMVIGVYVFNNTFCSWKRPITIDNLALLHLSPTYCLKDVTRENISETSCV
jgi:hypothetical protein